eukprot:Rmarinus@m.853
MRRTSWKRFGWVCLPKHRTQVKCRRCLACIGQARCLQVGRRPLFEKAVKEQSEIPLVDLEDCILKADINLGISVFFFSRFLVVMSKCSIPLCTLFNKRTINK